MAENKKRLVYLDIARGICILFVVFGHTLIPNLRQNNHIIKFIYDFIYSFHMATFFIISGIIFENNVHKYNDTKKFLNKKFKLLIVPYLVYSIISYVGINICINIPKISEILKSAGYKTSSLKDMIVSILLYNNHIDKHLWFVYLLFIIFIINIFTKNDKRKSLLISATIVAVSTIFKLGKYWHIFQYSLYFCSFSIGRFYNNKEMINKWKLCLLFIISNILIIGSIFINTNEYVKIVYKLVTGATTAFFIVEASKYIEEIVNCKRVLTKLSEYSYEIYLIHQPFIVSGTMGILQKLNYLPVFINITIVTLLGIFIPIVISKYLLSKNRFLASLFLGRKLVQSS